MEDRDRRAEEENRKTAEIIRKASEDIEIPEELKPEAIEAMLRERAGKGKQKKNYQRYVRIYGGTAAAAAAVFLMAVGIHRSGFRQDGMLVMDASALELSDTLMEMEEEAEDFMELETGQKEAGAPEKEPIKRASGYGEVYAHLEEPYQCIMKEYAADGTSSGEADVAVLESQGEQKFEEKIRAESAAKDYSTTNVREAGVDEADIVKTDGDYIYTAAASSNKVQIVKTEDLQICAEVNIEGIGSIREIYVENGRLVILSGGGDTALAEDKDGMFYSEYRKEAAVTVYDIRNPEKPKKTGSVSQEGEYRTSRKVGDYLYVFTDCWKQKGDEADVESYIPEAGGKLLSEDSIYLPMEQASGHYILMSSVDLNAPSEIVDAKGVLCDGGTYYITKQHMYITQVHYDNGNGSDETEIFKFHFDDGKIRAQGIGLVPGNLQDSFCIDEYDGKLRIVATNWNNGEMKTGLYVLDEKLSIIGSIEDIAPGENLRSARFLGNIGYFVTFRQTDPLFCVDLSKPEAPVILGELKVSGFSSYLHPYGEGKLLGMGQEAEESSGRVTGYKLSMFDVSRAGEMKELDKVVFRDVELVGLNNYKAVLADEEKNVIGVCLEEWKNGRQSLKYQIYGFEEEQGFVKLLEYDMAAAAGINAYQVRGLYIGDTFYVTSPKEITAFAMDENYKKTGSLTLSK